MPRNYSAEYRRYIARKPWQWQVYRLKQRAKEQGFDFDLDDAWFEERWYKGCELTGIKFEKVANKRHPRAQSVDRIDCNKGYTKDNCRLVLLSVNMFKQTGSDAEMLEVAKALVQRLS